MKLLRFPALILLAAALAAADEGSCSILNDTTSDDPANPADPAAPFSDNFNGGLIFWRGAPAAGPGHDPGSGNPLPAMQVGSQALTPTGAVTLRMFDISAGLVIEADVFTLPPSPPPAAPPAVWFGLSDQDEPTATPVLAAGQYIDAAGTIHFQINGGDAGTASAPPTGQWNRLTTLIKPDRTVEFRVNGAVALTAGTVDAAHLVRPVKAGGDGYPERPHIDNVAARRP
jgi:hypothetical protein